jgi:hypothetical protein
MGRLTGAAKYGWMTADVLGISKWTVLLYDYRYTDFSLLLLV